MSDDLGKFEAQRDKVVRDTIDRMTKNEMIHNERAGIKKSEDAVRKDYENIAYKTERQKGAALYKHK